MFGFWFVSMFCLLVWIFGVCLVLGGLFWVVGFTIGFELCFGFSVGSGFGFGLSWFYCRVGCRIWF